MRSTLNGLKIRVPSSSPPFNIMRAKVATSSAVENTPACPDTPAILRVVGSWTLPRRKLPSASRSVGAMRERSSADGRKAVSVIPSGSKIRSLANTSKGFPLVLRTISASKM